MGRFAPPGYPKIRSTPSRWRASRTISAPVIVAPTSRVEKESPRLSRRGLCLLSSYRSSGRAKPRLSEAGKEEADDYERSCHVREPQSTRAIGARVVTEPQRLPAILW